MKFNLSKTWVCNDSNSKGICSKQSDSSPAFSFSSLTITHFLFLSALSKISSSNFTVITIIIINRSQFTVSFGEKCHWTSINDQQSPFNLGLVSCSIGAKLRSDCRFEYYKKGDRLATAKKSIKLLLAK